MVVCCSQFVHSIFNHEGSCMQKMTKLAVLCSVLAGTGMVSNEAFAAPTLYRAPVASNYAGINYWFDHLPGSGFLRYDGKTGADGVGYDGHDGTDFKVSTGGAWAGAKGTVYEVVNNCADDAVSSVDRACGNKYGNHVRMVHADGKATIYGHMKKSSVVVAKNQYVLCSALLGNVGNSGTSDGAHLHFELRTSSSLTSYAKVDFFGPYTYWVNPNGGLPTTQCQ